MRENINPEIQNKNIKESLWGYRKESHCHLYYLAYILALFKINDSVVGYDNDFLYSFEDTYYEANSKKLKIQCPTRKLKLSNSLQTQKSMSFNFCFRRD
ncbi:hypothetical protein MHBO_004592 [Bonamia ostreae]|uniref:Uncharacterized protein n=1 Tax=Bonamia ostreae TaxID=126728 RepID=A0ABV2ATR1_9EUKA